jgi:hypothetical protein
MNAYSRLLALAAAAGALLMPGNATRAQLLITGNAILPPFPPKRGSPGFDVFQIAPLKGVRRELGHTPKFICSFLRQKAAGLNGAVRPGTGTAARIGRAPVHRFDLL